jgi:hypothetical protein
MPCGRGPGRALPPRDRGRDQRAHHVQSPDRGHHRIRPAGRCGSRRRDHPGRPGPLTADRPQARLRRDHHPHRPRLGSTTPRRRPGQTTGHPGLAGRTLGQGQGLHLPPLRTATAMVRCPPRPTLVERRTNLASQSRAALRLPTAPSLRWGDPPGSTNATSARTSPRET